MSLVLSPVVLGEWREGSVGLAGCKSDIWAGVGGMSALNGAMKEWQKKKKKTTLSHSPSLCSFNVHVTYVKFVVCGAGISFQALLSLGREERALLVETENKIFYALRCTLLDTRTSTFTRASHKVDTCT